MKRKRSLKNDSDKRQKTNLMLSVGHRKKNRVLPSPEMMEQLKKTKLREIKNFLEVNKLCNVKEKIEKKERRKIIKKGEKHELYSHQIDGVNWIFKRHTKKNAPGCIIGDEMGMGKTIEAICFVNLLSKELKNLEENKFFLIIAQKNMTNKWIEEIIKWEESITHIINFEGKKNYDFTKKVLKTIFQEESLKKKKMRIIIISTVNALINNMDIFYDNGFAEKEKKRRIWNQDLDSFFSEEDKFWKTNPFQTIIYDEAHHARNLNTNIHRSVKSFKSKSMVLLTGTPLNNYSWEFVNLLKLFSNYDFFKNSKDFKEHFKRLTPHLNKIKKEMFLRRLKKDTKIMKYRNVEIFLWINFQNFQKECYYKLMKTKNSGNVIEKMTYLTSMCQHPFLSHINLLRKNDKTREESELFFERLKIEHLFFSSKIKVLDLILSIHLKNEENKVVIFVQHIALLDLICCLMFIRNIEHVKVNGTFSGKQRSHILNIFHNDRKKRVLIATTTSMGNGISILSASLAIIFDPDWCPKNDDQAASRCLRINQKRNMLIIRMFLSGSIEFLKRRIQTQKIMEEESFMNGKSFDFKKIVDKNFQERIENIFNNNSIDNKGLEPIKNINNYPEEFSNVFKELMTSSLVSNLYEKV